MKGKELESECDGEESKTKEGESFVRNFNCLLECLLYIITVYLLCNDMPIVQPRIWTLDIRQQMKIIHLPIGPEPNPFLSSPIPELLLFFVFTFPLLYHLSPHAAMTISALNLIWLKYMMLSIKLVPILCDEQADFVHPNDVSFQPNLPLSCLSAYCFPCERET